MASNIDLPSIDLDSCAREPIRIPGSIQPHGALLVCSAELEILQASVNAAAILNHHGNPVHRSLAEVCGTAFVEEIRSWLAALEAPLLRTMAINGQVLQVLGHRTAQGVVLEFEQPPASEGETLEALYPRIGRFMEELQEQGDLMELCAAAAREFRRISRFNRVLIYRFDAEWNGEVLAQDSDGVLPSYSGLRFPASDIPAQARDLYRSNRLRIIPDANYQPVAIEPALSPFDGNPLDLSSSALRSVSPIHLQYMRNMGTLASMSISILVDGKLWGLVSCHNALPLRANAQVRSACDLLGTVLSNHIGASERSAYAAARIRLKEIETRLLVHMGEADSMNAALAEHPEFWLQFANASGVAIMTADDVSVAGRTPPAARIRRLAELMDERGARDRFVTSRLSLDYPEFADTVAVASGVLALSISQLHRSYIFWFRPELISTVQWAGDPHKPVSTSTEPLQPRHSFATWAEQVRGRSASWDRATIDAASDLRSAMINIVLRRAEERAELTTQLQRSNRELESFSYSISHDLRAPFRHIVGYTQLLRDREESLSEKARHYLASINEAAATAGQLVDDLLSFSHLGRTSLDHANVDMSKLIQEVLRTLEPDLRERQIVWEIQSLPVAWGDAAMLRQAFVNLIDNAVKYTREKHPAVISIRGSSDDKHCIYEVQDNGVGFDMSYVHKLFGVFQRLHRMEDFEGTGIGLALTKRIVERHGGWITADATLNGGATFRFGLPRK
jgi:light-regulated signal transduction histidine kinase (bacteriophytochrome)